MSACISCRLATCAGTCVCTITRRSTADHVEAGYCPHPQGARFGTADYPAGWPSRGLGDTVAKAIQVVTLGMVTSCGGCKERQGKLNAAVPYGSPHADEGEPIEGR